MNAKSIRSTDLPRFARVARFTPRKEPTRLQNRSSTPLDERVAAVKARLTLAGVVGRSVKLVRKGRELHGCCPFHTENTPSFTVVEDKGFAHCFGCGWHGDLIQFIMDIEGCSFAEAMNRLEDDAGYGSVVAASGARLQLVRDSAYAPADFVDGAEAAASIWAETTPARGTIVEAWLRARGLDPFATGALDVLRFHHGCPTGLWRIGADRHSIRRTAPAMVAPIFHIIGGRNGRRLAMRGVHITYLSADGRSKAALPSWTDADGHSHAPAARRIWGGLARGAVLIPARPIDADDNLIATLLRAIDAPGTCAIGEGLESSLSFAARQADVRLICAALSLGNLEGTQNAAIVDDRQVYPIWHPVGAEHGMPFSFCEPGEVAIGLDNDMKPTAPIWIQERADGPAIKRALTSAERANRSAQLAQWYWHHAGATTVQTAIAPDGMDFNDLDQAEFGLAKPSTRA